MRENLYYLLLLRLYGHPVYSVCCVRRETRKILGVGSVYLVGGGISFVGMVMVQIRW